jgi:O-antigen ligase
MVDSRASVNGHATAAAGRSPHRRPQGARTPQSGRLEPGNGVLTVVAVTVALMPAVHPKLPGNSGPIDGLIALSVFVVFLWVLRNRAAIRLPYVVPMTGLVVTGLASAMLSASPAWGAMAVIQEIFLLLWCAALATLCRTPRALRVIMHTWALSATAWAGLLVVAVFAGATAIYGAPSGGGERVRLFFDHPNMAGNYFMIALFVVVASRCPRRLWARVGACAVLFTAVLMTGSNAALLSVVFGVVVAMFVHERARAGLVTAIAKVAIVLALLSLAWIEIGSPLVTSAQQSDNALLRYSVGRGAESAQGRVTLFQSQFALFEEATWLGVGPSGTREALNAEGAQWVKEAHNDYLGTLVERGPLGALALAGLMGAVATRAIHVMRRPLRPRLAAVIPVPAALVGACAAFASTAVTHEVLHYRWFWSILAVLAAVHLMARPDSGDARPGIGAALLRRSTLISTAARAR